MARPQQPALEYRKYNLPADLPILVLTGDQWHISAVPASRLHFHNCLEIGICHSASGTMICDHQHIHFHAGDVTCIARNIPHTTWSEAGQSSLWSYLFLDPDAILEGTMLNEYAGLIHGKRFATDCSLLLSPQEYPWATFLVLEIIQEMTRREPGYQTSVRGLCAALLVRLMRVYGEADRENLRDSYVHVLSPAFDYIHDHYAQSFPQEMLAEVCHLSPTHFRRLFKAQTGMSPLAFLHQTRVLQSCSLLRTSSMSVMEIADQVGYNTISSFNRHFMQATGCAPTAWRKMSGKDLPPLPALRGWTAAEALEVVPSQGET